MKAALTIVVKVNSYQDFVEVSLVITRKDYFFLLPFFKVNMTNFGNQRFTENESRYLTGLSGRIYFNYPVFRVSGQIAKITICDYRKKIFRT